MKKTFYLLRLRCGANTVMNEVKYKEKSEAIAFYQRLYPELNLNNNGYAQADEMTSYCIVGKFSE